MNESISIRAICPYFVRHGLIRNTHYIECESIYDARKLGFDVKQRSSFDKASEYEDFTEIFCCDMYDTCPVFKAILQNREEEDAKKCIKEKKKRKI